MDTAGVSGSIRTIDTGWSQRQFIVGTWRCFGQVIRLDELVSVARPKLVPIKYSY